MRSWVLPMLLATACTGGMQDPSTVEQQEGACLALEDRRFESLDDLECGLTPDGVALCRWQLTFIARDDESSAFQWTYSDVAESGNIECDGGTITSITGAPRRVDGTFDPITQKLVWEGQTYAPAE